MGLSLRMLSFSLCSEGPARTCSENCTRSAPASRRAAVNRKLAGKVATQTNLTLE